MTNKKKQGRQNNPKKQAKKDGAAADTGPSLPKPEEKPKQLSNPQLTSLIIVMVGAAKLWDWRTALEQVTELVDGSSANNTTSTSDTNLCEYYMLTNDQVDYDDVCRSSETKTMMTLRYHSALQLLGLVVYIMLKCWHRDDLLIRFNGFLSVAPISSTLILLQLAAGYLTSRPSMILTCISGTLMVLALSAASLTLREMAQGYFRQPSRRASLQCLGLASMICLNLYETVQWLMMAVSTSSTNGSSAIIKLPLEWNDAWSVFGYTLMMDKFAISWMLFFVWLCFEEHRQRSILLMFSILKIAEVVVHISGYDQADFETDLTAMRATSMTCAVLCGIAWITPNLHLSDKPVEEEDEEEDDCPDLVVLDEPNKKSTKVE